MSEICRYRGAIDAILIYREEGAAKIIRRRGELYGDGFNGILMRQGTAYPRHVPITRA